MPRELHLSAYRFAWSCRLSFPLGLALEVDSRTFLTLSRQSFASDRSWINSRKAVIENGRTKIAAGRTAAGSAERRESDCERSAENGRGGARPETARGI